MDLLLFLIMHYSSSHWHLFSRNGARNRTFSSMIQKLVQKLCRQIFFWSSNRKNNSRRWIMNWLVFGNASVQTQRSGARLILKFLRNHKLKFYYIVNKHLYAPSLEITKMHQFKHNSAMAQPEINYGMDWSIYLHVIMWGQNRIYLISVLIFLIVIWRNPLSRNASV